LPQALQSATVLLVISLLPVAGWIARNHAVFSVARLSNSDAVMTVYFAGAGAYQVEHGLTLEEAQQRISREFDLPPPEHTNNHWIATRSVAEMDADLRAASGQILRKYPKSLLVSSCWAVVKATFSHNVGLFAAMLGREWIPPSMSGLARLDAAALDRLGQNGPALAAVFGWQVAHNALTWALFAVGVVVALRRRQTRPIALTLLVLLAYFQLTVALVGLDAYCRSRTPHMPFAMALAGVALGAARLPINHRKKSVDAAGQLARSPCPVCP